MVEQEETPRPVVWPGLAQYGDRHGALVLGAAGAVAQRPRGSAPAGRVWRGRATPRSPARPGSMASRQRPAPRPPARDRRADGDRPARCCSPCSSSPRPRRACRPAARGRPGASGTRRAASGECRGDRRPRFSASRRSCRASAGRPRISSHRAYRGATPRSVRTVSRVPKVRRGLPVAPSSSWISPKSARADMEVESRATRRSAASRASSEAMPAHETRRPAPEALRRCALCGARASAARAPPPGPGPRSPFRAACPLEVELGPAAHGPVRRSGLARPGTGRRRGPARAPRPRRGRAGCGHRLWDVQVRRCGREGRTPPRRSVSARSAAQRWACPGSIWLPDVWECRQKLASPMLTLSVVRPPCPPLPPGRRRTDRRTPRAAPGPRRRHRACGRHTRWRTAPAAAR